MKPFATFLALFFSLQLIAQQYTTALFRDDLRAVQVMEDYNDPFSVVIQYEEAPHPVRNEFYKAFLRQQKLEAQKQYPVRPGTSLTNRSSIPAPEILASFSGNNIISSTPLDNHLAIATAEHVVSTINVHMLVTNNVGFWLGNYQLSSFFASVGIGDRYFDPRVIYDPVEDRFILVLINGGECAESQIVLAFSQTNNPRGAWNIYAIDGCLDDDGTFADYPMIAITETELFLTYNEVNADSSWQTGFMGTQIHQINKMNGFNGEALNRKVWRDITYNGRLLRNICPIRNADETLPSDMYLLSNRNFDIENDTVFLIHIEGQQDDPEAKLEIEYRVCDNPYGVPPYAVQTRDSMDTNDARVLDGFRLDNQIQWVNNSMDFSTGRSGFFHGTLTLNDPSFTATGNVVGHPTDYLGYPGIAWTGSNPGEQDAIIVVSHTSPTRNPGGSAIYSNGLGEYSDFVTIIEGQKPVDMLQGQVERWGDYIGIQRLYHQPGSVWISCSYGRGTNANEAWIAKLARVEENTAVVPIDPAEISLKTYPNPSTDYVVLEFENPDREDFTVKLFDVNGTLVNQLFSGPATYSGKAKIHFSMEPLPDGVYLVEVALGGKPVVAKRVVKQ